MIQRQQHRAHLILLAYRPRMALTSFLLVLKVPPVPFGGVVAAVRHGLVKGRLDSVDGGQLWENSGRINRE